MKTILKITAGILLAGTIAIVAVAALVGSAASSVDKQMTQAAAQVDKNTTATADAATPKTHKKAKPKPGTITFRAYRSVTTGMTKSQVRHLIGAPQDITRDETDLGEFGGVQKTEMWSYGNRGGSVLDMNGFMFTFTNGTLDSKTSL